MENTQLSSKNNLFTGNIYQNNDTWINILDETEFLNKVLKTVRFQLFYPTPVYYAGCPFRYKWKLTIHNFMVDHRITSLPEYEPIKYPVPEPPCSDFFVYF